jgi:hypothetical protein
MTDGFVVPSMGKQNHQFLDSRHYAIRSKHKTIHGAKEHILL